MTDDFREYVTSDGGPGEPKAISTRIVIPALADDDRAEYLICQMCLRTMHKEKLRRVEIRRGVLVCRCCASLAQDSDLGDRQMDDWLALPIEKRRAILAATYGIDPATRTVSDVELSEDRFYEDVDDAPLAVIPRKVWGRYGGSPMMPRNYWTLVSERGPGVL